jgi:methyl-accepting chemotaxis protein
MRATLQMKLMASFAAVLAIMVLVAAFSYKPQEQRDQTVSGMMEAMQVLGRIDDLQTSWIDMQTDLREYLLAGRQESLDSYKASRSQYLAALADLKRLDADDEQELAAWQEIERLGDSWDSEWAEPALKLRQDVTDGRATIQQAIDLAVSDQDHHFLDTIRSRASAAKQAEQSLLAERQRADVAERNLGLAIVLWGTVLAVLAGIMIAYLLARTIARSARRMASVADGTPGVSSTTRLM